MFILIVGSGRLGVGLARAMSSRQDDVVIIDNDLDTARLGEGFDGLIVDGDPLDMEVLEKAGAKSAKLFLAVLADDNANIFCAQAAKTIFGISSVLARIADPEKEAFYRGMGLDTVCPTVTGINQVLELIMKDRFSSLSANLDPSLLCIYPPEGWVGLPFSKVRPPDRTKIVGVLKNGRIAKLSGRDIVQRDETLVVVRGKEGGGRLWIA